MKPAAFEYFRPRTLEETLEILRRYEPEAKVLAGGQSLVPLMNFRLAQPRYLIDIGGLNDLAEIREQNGSLAIGAMARQSAIEDSPVVRDKSPLLLEATKLVAHRTVRNRGTIGGSLAHADPSAEYPAVLTALDGEVVAVGPDGERVIPAPELFLTVCTTTLAPTEVLTEVRLPATGPRTGCAFTELSRRHGDWAIVGVAATISLTKDGQCEEARIALAGAGQVPLRCREAERLLQGRAPVAELIKEAAESCEAAAEPLEDIHASAAYKKAMVRVFVERALTTALSRAQRGQHAA